jgi:hypothetical protein
VHPAPAFLLLLTMLLVSYSRQLITRPPSVHLIIYLIVWDMIIGSTGNCALGIVFLLNIIHCGSYLLSVNSVNSTVTSFHYLTKDNSLHKLLFLLFPSSDVCLRRQCIFLLLQSCFFLDLKFSQWLKLLESFQAITHVSWLYMTNVSSLSPSRSVWPQILMKETEMVPETSVIFNQLTWLLDQEDFSKLSVLCVYHYSLELQIITDTFWHIIPFWSITSFLDMICIFWWTTLVLALNLVT